MNVNLPSTLAGAGSFALSILNAGYLLDVELSALQTEGRGEVISNPRVVTSNQKEAVITQGREIGYLTVTGGQSNNVPTVQFKEALLQLKVTPTITNDGRVFLNMVVTKNEQDGSHRPRRLRLRADDRQARSQHRGAGRRRPDRGDRRRLRVQGPATTCPRCRSSATSRSSATCSRSKTRTKEKAELLVFVTPKILKVAQRN